MHADTCPPLDTGKHTLQVSPHIQVAQNSRAGDSFQPSLCLQASTRSETRANKERRFIIGQNKEGMYQFFFSYTKASRKTTDLLQLKKDTHISATYTSFKWQEHSA
jgi:hypothetical protein